MKSVLIAVQIFCAIPICGAQSGARTTRMEAEYYVAAYATHYHVPLALARAIVERESNWQRCAISPKGAVGLMQLMPGTAKRLGITDRCNPDQNISSGVRYLGSLMRQFPMISGSSLLPTTSARTESTKEASLTEIPMWSRMSQEFEQVIFAKRGLSPRAVHPL